ncbi:acetylserotonin O-methyltransferase-like [Pogona vitticeps]
MDSIEDFESIQVLHQYQYGLLISKVMFTASELGVFDLLLESGEPLSSGAIAEHLGTSPSGMERLLEACVGLKFLRMERKENRSLYGNSALADLYLAKSSPKSQYNFMNLLSENLYPSAQYLTEAVREGTEQLESIYGASSKNCFEVLYRSDERLYRFSRAMDDVWSLCGKEVVSAFDLSNFPLICDVGGAAGTLAKECISLYPNSTAIVFDLPEVVESLKKDPAFSQESWMTFQTGDFFKDPVPEADLYILARILHSWNDEKCIQLLTKLHRACKPGGGVLVVELVLDEDKCGPPEAHLYSMLMLLHNKGKERTSSEYQALFTAAGFKEMQLKKGTLYDTLMGRK